MMHGSKRQDKKPTGCRCAQMIAESVIPQLNRIERYTRLSLRVEGDIMAILDDLEARMTEVETVEGSQEVLLISLKKALDDAIQSGDMTRVTAINDRLTALREKIIAATVANTPVDPNAPPA